MRRQRAARFLAAALGLPAVAHGYAGTFEVLMEFGGNAGQDGSGALNPVLPLTPLSDIGWLSGGINALGTMSDGTWFSTLGGYNSRTYYNTDFATAAQCAALVAGLDGTPTATRKYGCRFTTYSGTPSFAATPVADVGPDTGRAVGIVTVTDTTLTGTLTVVATTDEPTGATTTLTSSGSRISTSVGNGATGFNYRAQDGSPFGNLWYGVSTLATFELDLTGTFTASNWQVTGGTVRLADPEFTCQQGGLGSTTDAAAGTLCTRGTQAGGHQYDGAHLSFGWDPDGSGPGTTTTEIEVRNAAGDTVVDTLAGVRAELEVDEVGNLVTVSGEFRRGVGSAGGGCANHLRWDGGKISCGSLYVGRWSLTSTVLEPVRDAVDDAATAWGTDPEPIAVMANDRWYGQLTPTTVAIVAPPASGTAVVSGSPGEAGDIRVTYQAAPGFTGTDTFTYGASDSAGGDQAVVTVTVNAPTAFDDAAKTPFDQALAIPVAANDRGFADPVTVTLQSEPGLGSAVVLGSPGPRGGVSVLYSPLAGYTGPDSFTYLVSDGAVTDAATVAVTVQATAQDDGATTTQGKPIELDVLANDVGFASPVTVTVVQAPSHGAAVVAGSPGAPAGIRITYTPAAGFTGQDAFTYTAGSGAALDAATVTVNVLADQDGDGIVDGADNCTAAANANQRDTNGDGYGNRCDADLDDNGFVNAADLAAFRLRFGTTDPHADLDGNGAVNAADLAILRTLFGKPPGPSGLAP